MEGDSLARLLNQTGTMAFATQRLLSGSPLPTLLSVPAGEVPPEGWPVLFFLHGYDEAHPLDLSSGATRHGPLKRGNPSSVVARFLIVAPQLPRAGDIWRDHSDAVREIVTTAESEHTTDSSRRYLTGFSFGGNGVFDLALAQPDLWTAAWPVDPTRVPPADLRIPVWLSLGQLSRRLVERYVERLHLRPAAEDGAGGRVYLDQGEDHVGAARRAYSDERIYEWLLQWRSR